MTTLRNGPSWEAFLKRYRLRNITDAADGGWNVESASGATYHVTTHMKMHRDSGSYYFKSRCTCPARTQCRHVTAVLNMREAEAIAAEDYDGVEMVEREVL